MNKKEYLKNYTELNKEEIKEYKKDWYNKNKEKIKEKSKIYYQENKEKIKERNKMNRIEMNNSDVNYKIKNNVLSNVQSGIRNGFFDKRLEKTLGYTVNILMIKIEKNFIDEMNWNNFGSRFIHIRNWHIHHIVPMKIYNFYNEDEIKKCWDLENLLPRWNDERSDEIDWDEIRKRKLERILPDTILVDDMAGNRYEI